MLYLDYSRPEGGWIRHGGRENLEAIEFMRRFNREVFGKFPNATTVLRNRGMATVVSPTTEFGGLGFGYKWNMGWMHDTLSYFGKDPIHRKHHHDQILFDYTMRSENFILPLSHDEVVHGKLSILGRMPGHDWQRFANLRAYYAFMFGHPGKKLMFMGAEFGQERNGIPITRSTGIFSNKPVIKGFRLCSGISTCSIAMCRRCTSSIAIQPASMDCSQ